MNVEISRQGNHTYLCVINSRNVNSLASKGQISIGKVTSPNIYEEVHLAAILI